MNRKLILLTAIVIALASGGLSYALLNTSDDCSRSVTPSIQADSDETVIKVGTIECLPLSDTSGAQNTSCAIGLKQDEETAYALQASDPTLTGSIPTGQRVQVTGTIVQNTSDLNAAGTIQVTDIEQL